MSDHTAGPWRIGDAGTTVFGPKSDNPSPVTIAKLKPAGGSHKANARLIAAAPELLAACARACDVILGGEDIETVEPWAQDICGEMLQAIAKAKGEV